MWRTFRPPQEKCTMERIETPPQRPSLHAVARVHLQFPPPPDYPPPHPSTSRMEEHCHPSTSQTVAVTTTASSPSPSSPTLDTFWDQTNDYSYAYYEPGPPTRHTNIPSRYPGTYREGHYRTRHTYLTHYGTEENIYEEISDVARARMLRPMPRRHHHRQQDSALNQSLVEEEVRRVQSGHRRVLGELNLAVEAMLMPTSSREGSSDDTDREAETEDQLADLLTVGPTDDLLSPMVQPNVDLDSGFSGSSSGASYRSVGGSLRRGPVQQDTQKGARGSVKMGSAAGESGVTATAKGFWGKKAWKKLAGFPSNISLNKNKDETRVRSSGTWEETPSACDHRLSSPQHHPHHHHHHHHHQHHRTHHLVRTLPLNASQRSSEGSWCSGSEPSLSSDDESDRSANSNRNNGQLRSTFNKAKTLCDKLRGSGAMGVGGGTNRSSYDGGETTNTSSTTPPPPLNQQQGRLSRWFSMRRGSAHQYDVENVDSTANRSPLNTGNKMPLLAEVDEENVFATALQQQQQHRRNLPPSLPPPPPDLTPQQLKRRMIVNAIVHSENSYVATLQRLVHDYKRPLEESSPAILSASKIAVLFHRLPEILQCHSLFRIALTECVRNWDKNEKIGDVFVASFSKAIVFDIYSGFINNFSVAMDLAKMEAKRKSALADFFKVKQICSSDRLSFFGLMVKPVQRFPQFILFLQDLLKHTPQGHHDRMSLQLALTQLESLAEMLNERKRESEQYQAFKEMLRHIGGKFSLRPLSDCNRYLLREDNVTQLEYNQNGMITKAKSRRLLLLNDLVVCVSVASKSHDDFSPGSGPSAAERLTLKWTHPVSEVEIQDTSTSPTLSRILTAGSAKSGSLKSNASFDGTTTHSSQDANNLCTEMSNLMQDYEIMSRIADLVGNLKGCYKDITLENAKRNLQQIQSLIQQKDEEMAWLDSCCLQLMVKTKGKEENYTFQTDNPSIKKEWITELRLAQLALDPNNSPAWEIPEQEHRPSTKMPLFVRSQRIYRSQHQNEVRCGCFYSLNTTKSTRNRRSRTQNYLWLCTTNGTSSHISVLTQHPQQMGVLREITSFPLVELQVTAMEYVKGLPLPCPNLASDAVWMGTDSHRLILYAADEPGNPEELASVSVADVITQIKSHYDNVYVALANGTLNVYKRSSLDGVWLLKDPVVIPLGTSNEPVSSLLPITTNLYAACGEKVWVLSGATGEVQKNFSVEHDHKDGVNLMAHSGVGLWISMKHSSTICLYHTETFKHLQDINVASNVMRITNPNDCTMHHSRSRVHVTSLLACKGLLWVGTNIGIVLTIPLPRLEGVPIISGRVNISYHAHYGPITFLLALQPKSTTTATPSIQPNEKIEERVNIIKTEIKRNTLLNSPIVLRRRHSKDCDRLSKTLPRTFGNVSVSSSSSGDTCDVYGLYGRLMYVKDYEGEDEETVYEALRRSDPELAAIPNKVSTLDRRLRMKASRPRSLDLSNWSVDSRSSSVCTTSSGSEESMTILRHHGRSVSRNNSNASRQLDEVSEDGVMEEKEAPPVKSCSTRTVAKANSDNVRRTVITLMGGRGYVNLRQCCTSTAPNEKSKGSLREWNRNDAHIVVWELKL